MDTAITASKMERLVSELVRMNLVIFTASGHDERTDFPDSIDLLHAKFASNYKIINVGAVYAADDPDTNGRRNGWSHGAENVVVSAHREMDCAFPATIYLASRWLMALAYQLLPLLDRWHIFSLFQSWVTI